MTFTVATAATPIRSSFCADGVRSGVRLFLIEDGAFFLVASKFQIVGRRKGINEAIALFERALAGDA